MVLGMEKGMVSEGYYGIKKTIRRLMDGLNWEFQFSSENMTKIT
jgi:hypothetical protein